MKTPILLLLATASLAAAQTRTATVNATGTLVYPDSAAFAAANDLPTLSGNNTFSGQNDFGSVRSGNLRFEEARDEVFSITVNGTASQLHSAGAQIYPDFGNVISVVEDSGLFYWSDENDWWMFYRSAAWSTPQEGAAALRSVISDFDPNSTGDYPYATSGTGATVTVTVAAQGIDDWSSSNSTLLPIEVTQQGQTSAWTGTGAVISAEGNITVSGNLTRNGGPIIDVTRPSSNGLNITSSGFPIFAGSGPWGHQTWTFGSQDLSATSQLLMTQFFCGGGNGFSTLGIVQGGKAFSAAGSANGPFEVFTANWTNFPSGEMGAVAMHPVKLRFIADLIEQSTPANPPADTARIFARDNGSGKTQLCVIFPTGAVQVLATQP
jgi:hypothetical protein